MVGDEVERQAPARQFRQRHPVNQPVLDHPKEMHEVGIIMVDGEPLVSQEVEAGEVGVEQLGL
jgi:hypothetical protein